MSAAEDITIISAEEAGAAFIYSISTNRYIRRQQQQQQGNERPTTPENLILWMIGQDSVRVHFIIRYYDTRMARLERAYAEHIGTEVANLRFLFEGRRIQDEDTPQSLRMEDRAVIRVFRENGFFRSAAELINMVYRAGIDDMFGAEGIEATDADRDMAIRHTSLTSFVSLVYMPPTPPQRRRQPLAAGNSIINLKAIGQDSNLLHFRVRYDTRMGRLMRAYAEKIGVHIGILRFLFDGRRVQEEETPQSLRMEEGDVMEVYQEQEQVQQGLTHKSVTFS